MSTAADFVTPARGTNQRGRGRGGGGGAPVPVTAVTAPRKAAAPAVAAGGSLPGHDDDDEDLVLKVTAATAVASLADAAAASAPPTTGTASVTPQEPPSSSSSSSSASEDGGKTVRFDPEHVLAGGSSSSLLGDAIKNAGGGGAASRGAGGGLVFSMSNRGRYVSPARRSSKCPSPGSGGVLGGALSAISSSSSCAETETKAPPSSSPSSWRQHQQPSFATHPQQHKPPQQPMLETAVTNSPSMEERHGKGKQKQPPEDREAEAASALAGVAAAAAAAAAAASASASENDALFEPKSPVPTMHEAGSMFLSTPRKEVMMTPTDFSVDYGKPLFDTSNVLAWLQSPSGLFSPGFGNILHSPSKQGTPGVNGCGAAAAAAGHQRPPSSTAANTPRTPVVSTSFFFSDVAKLPKGKNSKSIICISPLAMASRQHGLLSPRASNLSGVPGHPHHPAAAAAAANAASSGGAGGLGGAAPSEPGASTLPLLSDTPLRGPPRSTQGIVGVTKSERDPREREGGSSGAALSSSSSAGVDVHMAERDCMEDEDLSVLLQLAANSHSSVFRGKNSSKDLGLPMIGDGDRSARNNGDKTLSRKPTLEMRTSSDAASGSAAAAAAADLAPTETAASLEKKMGAGGESSKPSESKPEASMSGGSNNTKPKSGPSSSSFINSAGHSPRHSTLGYGHDSFYGPPSHHALLSMGVPPGAPTGTMHVIVGAPPPPASGPGAPPGSNPYHNYGMHAPQPPPYGGMYGYGPPPPHPSNYYYSYTPRPPPPPPPMPPSRLDQKPPAWSSSKKKKKSTGKRSPERTSNSSNVSSLASPGLLKLAPSTPTTETSAGSPTKKKRKPTDPNLPHKKKNRSPQLTDKSERAVAAKNIMAVNAASGGMNDKAASLAASILRGVTMRPSGKWQAQLYFAGKSRYIGVFDSREKAALAYEIAREKLKAGPSDHGGDPKVTENLVNLARKAAFEGVNEKLK